MNRPLRGRIDTHRAIAASAGIAMVVALAACGSGGGGGNGPGATKLDLVIGNSLPLSGSERDLGESSQKASELALDRIQDAIGSADADHTVRVVNEDQGSDADAAVASARQLVDSDQASCLSGPWSSEAAPQAAEDIAIPGKVLTISPVPAGANVAELSDHDLINSTSLPQSLEGSAIAKAIDSDLGGTQGHTVNVAVNHGSFGDTVGQDFVEAWQGEDGTVGDQVVLSPPPSSPTSTGDTSAYSGQAYLLLNSGPDAVVIIDDVNGFTALAPALAANPSWDPGTAWGGDELLTPSLPAQVGEDTVDGFRVLAPGAPADPAPSAAFVQAFESASPHNVKLAPYAAQQFDATILCYLAAVAAGSTDGQEMADELIDITAPGGTEYSWQQLPEAIKALQDGEDIDYTGASGPIDMDIQGNPTSGVFNVYRYSSGRLKVVDEIPVERPNPATP